MKDLTDADDYTSPITVPEGTDSRDDAAGDVERIAQALGNRTHYLKTRVDPIATDAARKSQSNTFTQPQIINVLTASDVPLLSTESKPDDYAPNAANRWKLELAFGQKSDSASYAALFVGQPPDGLAWVVNARWHLQTQRWRQLDAAKPSAALVMRARVCIASSVPAGAAPWADWPTGGAVDGGDIVAGGEFQFSPARATTSLVNLGLASGPGGVSGPIHGWYRDDTSTLWVNSVAGARLYVPIRLPKGAVLTKVEVRIVVPEQQASQVKLVQRTAKWGVAEMPPAIVTQDFGNTDGAWPNFGTAAWSGSITINETTEYEVCLINATNLAAVRLTWSDPGPRNV